VKAGQPPSFTTTRRPDPSGFMTQTPWPRATKAMRSLPGDQTGESSVTAGGDSRFSPEPSAFMR
jgi:hypothetical protein